MKNILKAIKHVYKNKNSYYISLATFLLTMLSYYWALRASVSLQVFLEVNSIGHIIFQVFISVLNSILAAISFSFTYHLIKTQQKGHGMSTLQSIFSLVFSIGTTGCYVCGSLLLPIAGISTSLATLPFGGLEVKFSSFFLFVLSIYELAPKVLGVCKTGKRWIFDLGFKKYSISYNKLRSARFLILSLMVFGLIFLIPVLFQKNEPEVKGTHDTQLCTDNKDN